MNESDHIKAHRRCTQDTSSPCGCNPNTCRSGKSNGCNCRAGANRVGDAPSFVGAGANTRNPAPEPSVLAKAIRYAKAIRRWIAAGRPARKPEEVMAIYRNECVPCENYNLDRSSCRLCGCRVAEEGPPLANKIAMATESCPLGKW